MNSSILEEEYRVQVIIDIIDILIYREIPISMLSEFTTNLTTLHSAYVALAQTFAVEPTNEGYSKFVDALDQVTKRKKAACDDKISSCADITSLASQYRMLISKKYSPSNILRIREIFGTILCIDELENFNGGEKRKRDAYEHCTCQACPIFSVDYFFICLDPENLKPILGMIESMQNGASPCLALVVDTTGSMSTEIESARYVIHKFLASEKQQLLCYLLVPFTDLSNDEYKKGSKLYDTFCMCYTILHENISM